MVAHWLLEGKPAQYPSGILPHPLLELKLRWHPVPQLVMLWQLAQTQKYASAVAVMATLLFGISTIKLWWDSFRVTLMELAALTFLQMEPNSGQEGWTTQSDPGTFERAASCNSMTSSLKSSVWVTVRLVIGLQLAWKAQMWKCSAPPSLTSISYTFMKVVYSLSSLPIVENGLSQLERTICWMLGGHPMEPQFSSQKKIPLSWAVTFHLMTST